MTGARRSVSLETVRSMLGIEPWWRRNERWARRVLRTVGIVLVALLPLRLDLRWTEIFVLSGVFALLALGLNVVVGFAGLLDLGYVAFWAIGAYSAAILTNSGPLQVFPFVLPIWVIFPMAMVICLLAGVILGAPVLRLRGDYLAIVTLGFGEIVRIVALNLNGVTRGARGISGTPDPQIPEWAWVNIPNFFIRIINGVATGLNAISPFGDIDKIDLVRGVGTVSFGVDPKPYYYLTFSVLLLAMFALRRLNNSRVGRAWVAIREDEDAAEAMGVPTLRMKILAFSIGAAVASFAGVIQVSRLGFVSPGSFQAFISIMILAMVILGGMGNMVGVIVGATAIIVFPEVFRGFEDYRFLVFGGVLVVMMIFRPQGIIPSKRRAAEMKEAPSMAAGTPLASPAGGELGEGGE